MFRLLSWILNAMVKWPGMMLVCETGWLERDWYMTVITPFWKGVDLVGLVMLSEKENSKFLVVVSVS